MRDDRDDQRLSRDHSKKRNFKKEDDKKAYETGYQAGRHGNQQDHK